MEKPVYHRVLLKISGEALAGDKHSGLDFEVIGQVCDVIKKCLDMGVQVGLVVGGGNFWRGAKNSGGGKMERSRADHIGMLATVMNCLAVADVCEQKGIPVRVQTAIEMRAIAEPYIRSRAIRHLEKGRVVIFGAGTGNPYFSTDTAAVLRAAEIDADVILLAKNVDGVYSADPVKDPTAVKYDSISYDDVLAQHLMVMDTTATSLSMDNHIPVLLFALKDPENIIRAVCGEKVGTIVKEYGSKGRNQTMLKDDYKIYEEKMQKSIDSAAADFASVRAGRANAAVLDRITVDYYGTPTPIQQIAAISTPDPRILQISPWDNSALKSIEKAILNSDLGINPQNDGRNHPPELPPADGGAPEGAGQADPQVRRERQGGRPQHPPGRHGAFKKKKKASEITEDDLKQAEKDLQKLTDESSKKIDELLARKEKELMEI